MSVWRDRARRRIAELTADLPAEATITERRKALSGKGWPAHQGTNWGRKMWGQECRKYLARHGDRAASATFASEFPDHVHFPWKGESDG